MHTCQIDPLSVYRLLCGRVGTCYVSVVQSSNNCQINSCASGWWNQMGRIA